MNKQLNNAKKNKKDEFYTLYETVADEIKAYPIQFKNKRVYSNCDDPRHSNFTRYFIDNFKRLGLQSYRSTCYRENDRGLSLYVDGSNIDQCLTDGKFDSVRVNALIETLDDDGSFDSPRALNFLGVSDIVVTNPPFSRFRDFIKLMLKQVDVLCLGNLSTFSSNPIMPLFSSGILTLGYSLHGGNCWFKIPDKYKDHYSNVKGGCVNFGFSAWVTSLPVCADDFGINNKVKYLENRNLYELDDKFGVLIVNRMKDIPCDYDGIMGVPITFLKHHNPKQYKLLGSENTVYGVSSLSVNGKRKYRRLIIEKC